MKILADAETATQVIELVEYRGRHWAPPSCGCTTACRIELRDPPYAPRHAAPEDGAR